MSSENDFSKNSRPAGPEVEAVDGPAHAALIARLHQEQCHPDYRYKTISAIVASDDHKFFNITPVLDAGETWEINPEIPERYAQASIVSYDWGVRHTFYLRCKN